MAEPDVKLSDMELDDWIAAAQYTRFDGQRIAYWTAGDGRPLLLVHGFPTSSWDWHRVWPDLARDRTLVACDMLGFGLSDKPASGYSIHRQTDLHDALLAELGVADYDAVVHDYGVSVGQELLARRNEGGKGLGRMCVSEWRSVSRAASPAACPAPGYQSTRIFGGLAHEPPTVW